MSEAGDREALIAAYRSGTVRPVTLTGRAAIAVQAAWRDDPAALAADALLAEMLVASPIHPISLERRLTAVRRGVLLNGAPEAAAPLVARLAIQAQLNEFAWAEAADETARVEAMAARLTELSPDEVMTLAAYRPLDRMAGAGDLVRRGWTGPATQVLAEHVVAPQVERALATRIPTLTPMAGEVTGAVRAQYEESPYPRWRRVTRMPITPSIFGVRVASQPTVLFAGCGTGYHAIHAGQRYENAKTLAVDLSRASLSYGLRKAKEAGIARMAFAQADLLALPDKGMSFDVIECSGVLHHMEDPFAGARRLMHMLNPGGLVKLGLYSATGRAPLAAAKAMARSYGPGRLRELRQAIADAPDGDPVKTPMRYTDFYAASSCRDLLMHVQEHELGIADVERMLRENGLRFLGFSIDDDAQAAYRAMFPNDRPTGELAHWGELEQARPDTFRGMYQFWAVRG